jgi:predicted nucleic acid-binding protein
MAFTALFDACVLYPPSVRDVLMSLASTDLFRARWTARIHSEWMEAVAEKKAIPVERLQRTKQLMEGALPDAEVTGYEGLIDCLELPDLNDRHVLAAAIVGRADVIVTLNLKDFPRSALAPYGIQPQHPDQFISHVLTLDPTTALLAMREMRGRLKNPPFTTEQFLELLGRQGLARTVTILQSQSGLI